MQFEIKLDEERPDPISEIQIKSEIKTPFTFPNFTLPHPPLSLVLGASLMSNCFGKVGENFGQMLPNLAMLNGFLLKRNEMLQNTVNFLMQNQRKEESIKKEDLEDMPKIKEENDV